MVERQWRLGIRGVRALPSGTRAPTGALSHTFSETLRRYRYLASAAFSRYTRTAAVGSTRPDDGINPSTQNPVMVDDVAREIRASIPADLASHAG